MTSETRIVFSLKYITPLQRNKEVAKMVHWLLPFVVATIFMLIFPCSTSAQESTYRPEVEFFVDVSEAEVAEATFGQLLRSPSGKKALDALRNVEKTLLIAEWSSEQWERFWGEFAGSSVAAGLKEMESLALTHDASQQFAIWAGLEQARLILLSYTPLATSPGKLQLVNSGLKNGSHLIKGFQDSLQRTSSWSPADDELMHNLVTGYKVVAFSRRGEDEGSSE